MASYINEVSKYLSELKDDPKKYAKAEKIITNTLEKSGIIYLFGCGHSHIFGEELFYRAGGLANVRPILYEPLMLHQGAMQSSVNERKNDFIDNFIQEYQFTQDDTIIVVSTSGINPVPIDVANYAQKNGAAVITISSFEYPKKSNSRHKSSLYLGEIGDVNIDNKVPYGDGIFGEELKFSPISTIIGIAIIQEILTNVLLSFPEDSLPVFKSGNINGSDEYNKKLAKKYETKIPELVKNLEVKL